MSFVEQQEATAAQETRVEQLPFVLGMVRLCTDGWNQGWHERNGGNASYRLTEQEAGQVRALVGAPSQPWVALEAPVSQVAGEFFLVTRTGGYMRNVADGVLAALGIIELDERGAAYRIVWGFANEGRPTSELASHLEIHAARKAASQGAARVIYHCHPTSIVALTSALPADSATVSKALWKVMTECIVVFPEGVGVVPFAVPGSYELAQETLKLARDYRAVIWAHHGLLATGSSYDDAFGLVHVIAKAAEIYGASCVLCGGPEFPEQLSDDDLRAIAAYWNLDVPLLGE